MRRVRDLQPYVGKTLEAKIIELDKNRNNVVLSRRAWLEQTQSEVRSEFLNKLAKGQVRTGVVSSIVNFGAFVDLGGVDGLVHVSELSWKHIDHPSEVVEVGQEVTVEVLDIDLDRERVSLSLKATQEDPWRQFARTHQIGQVVPGKVTKLVPFGAFVRVQDGIEGLVHISELAERHVEIPEQVVNVGDDLLVKVIDIDLERRRISLSLKQANEGALTEDTFDPAQYGMEAQYDDKGNYIYPDGFDPETQEWLPGYEEQREAWEKRYAAARERFEAHKKQLEDAQKADADAAVETGEASSYTSEAPETRPARWLRTRRWPRCARSSPAGKYTSASGPGPTWSRAVRLEWVDADRTERGSRVREVDRRRDARPARRGGHRRRRHRPRGRRAGHAGIRGRRRRVRGRRRAGRPPRPAGPREDRVQRRRRPRRLNAIVHPLVGERTAEVMAAGSRRARSSCTTCRCWSSRTGRRLRQGRHRAGPAPRSGCGASPNAGWVPTTRRPGWPSRPSDEQRRAVADEIVTNDGSHADLEAQVDALWHRLTG